MTMKTDEYTGPGARHLGAGPKWAGAHASAVFVWAEAQRRYAGDRLASVARGLEWAMELHGGADGNGQVRPDGGPYVEHVLTVAERTMRWAPLATSDMVVASLLHDSVEDHASKVAARAHTVTGDDRERALHAIEQAFGARTRKLVALLTNPVNPSVETGSADPVAIKNTRYFLHFDHIFRTDTHASLIKLADFSTNAFTLDGLRELQPEKYAKLLNKYRPCVALVREYLKIADRDSPFFAVRDELMATLEAAWARDYETQ